MEEISNETMETPEEKVNKIKTTSADIIVTNTNEKPYYEIKYLNLDSNEYHVGYSSYDLNIVKDYLSNYFEIVDKEAYDDSDDRYLICIFNDGSTEYFQKKCNSIEMSKNDNAVLFYEVDKNDNKLLLGVIPYSSIKEVKNMNDMN